MHGHMIHSVIFNYMMSDVLHGIRAKLIYYEDEYQKLKGHINVGACTLEVEMNEDISFEEVTHHQKKIKT